MSISRNAAYNAVGAVLPSILTLVTIPLYLSFVGIERYGILTLCWVILGYSQFLDTGLGLAVARKIAEARNEHEAGAAEILWTAAWIALLLGLLGAAAVYFGAIFYFGSIAQVTTDFGREVEEAIPLLAAIVPMGMLSSVFNGALQGRERFLAINAVAAFGQTLVFLPLVLAYLWTPSLAALITGALAGRILSLLALYLICRRTVRLGAPKKPSLGLIRNLLTFGGWLALITIATALFNSLDRLAIGSAIGGAAVAAYAIPYGLISRIILIPHALAAALFPRYAYADAGERLHLTSSSIQAVAVIVTPATIGLVAVAEPFFKLWIGPELAATSAPIVYILGAGFWIYCIGHMALSMLYATGKPDRVAKLLFAELVPYWGVLLIGLSAFGLNGAAAAFTVRATVDCGLMLALAAVPLAAIKRLVLPAALTLAAIAAAAGITGPFRYPVLAIVFLGSVIWSASNIPDVLRPYLRKIMSVYPFRRVAADDR